MAGENLGRQWAHLFPFCPFPLCCHAPGKFLCLRSSFFFSFKINIKATALAISNFPSTLPCRLRSLHATARWTSLFQSPSGYTCLDLCGTETLATALRATFLPSPVFLPRPLLVVARASPAPCRPSCIPPRGLPALFQFSYVLLSSPR